MLGLFSSKRRLAMKAARDLYNRIMVQSRNPDFYADYKIPDTLEGRFEVLVLHAGLVVNRLSQPDMGAEGRILAQALFDVMFSNLDWALRETGVGDLAVPRRVKRMMESFKGRSFAYDEALKSGAGEIKYTLIRNMYGTVSTPHGRELDDMTEYVQICAEKLALQGLSDYGRGHVQFPELRANVEGSGCVKQAA